MVTTLRDRLHDLSPEIVKTLRMVFWDDLYATNAIHDILEIHPDWEDDKRGVFSETVYDIIPKKLLKKLMDLLESLKLVAVWHYLVIAITVAAALFLIYIFQKKLFSREKLIERRITKGQCQECSKHLPAGSVACPFCGFAQFKACSSCGKMTLVYGKYCKECGKGQ